MSVVVGFRIDRRIKRKMDELKHINWSEIFREAVIETIRREEEKRKKDLAKVRRAALRSGRLSRKVEGWRSVEEIRKWRERSR
ncbi:MAG: hypothetical protein DRO18_07315 [Thermoprotei archaeon]|nr:MAG: hypothetical protein DRO18_07315 [Thermoprotei archaeon]